MKDKAVFMASNGNKVSTVPILTPESSEQEMNIFLKVIKTVPINVNKSETIKNLKSMLCEREASSEYLQELFFSGERLKDDCKLVDCGIRENSTLHLFLQKSVIIKLNIIIPSEKITFLVEAKVHDTIQNVKSLVQSKREDTFESIYLPPMVAREVIHIDRYTLFHGGILLEDCRTLASLGIKGESTLHLVFDIPKDVVTIFVKLRTGETVKMEVKLSYTVDVVKTITESKAGIPVSDHVLIYSGQPLEGSKTLASYDIEEKSILEMGVAGFRIFVKNSMCKTISIVVQQQDDIEDVKMKISSILGVSPGLQLLIYGIKQLKDGRSLADYGIMEDFTIRMINRLTGC